MSETKQRNKTYFFAYPGSPNLQAEVMREAATSCTKRGMSATTWQQLNVAGTLMIDRILSAIDKADVCVAEISSPNPNVLFEAGYAIAKEKEVYFAIDETDDEALRLWQGLSLVEPIGRLQHGGNSEILANELLNIQAHANPPLIQNLLANAKPKEENAVFAPPCVSRSNPAERLTRFLERSTHLNILASEDELGHGTLAYYTSEIYRSSAAIFHFVKPTRSTATQYNARLALLAGIARGLEIPVLMVAEEGYKTPLDYKDLLYTYDNSSKLVSHAEQWLKNLPASSGSKKRLGRLILDVEIPLRTFGQHVAESEREDLASYFVHTNEFESVLSGRTKVFTGRKGTGKTATMQQAVSELRTDRRILVVPVKPSSYDLRNLLEMMSAYSTPSRREYFLINLWSYLLTTEIAKRCLAHASEMPAGFGSDDAVMKLEEVVSSLSIILDGDVSLRLDEIVAGLPLNDGTDSPQNDAIELLRSKWQNQLLPNLLPVLSRYDRVAVLVDNLDKTWEKGEDFALLSQFLLALLVTSGRLEGEFRKRGRDSTVINLTTTVFLRTDIYDVMSTHAREPDKINHEVIQWSDEELLIRVLEDRYAANIKHSRGQPSNMWEDLFDTEVHGQSTRDYFLWRALPRPRDIIFLGNAALTTAINRRHSQVSRHDVVLASEKYSRFAVEALLVESEAQGFDLESILIELSGVEATMTEDTWNALFDSENNGERITQWLIQTNFLGLEGGNESFTFVEGEKDARKKLIAYRRLAQRQNRPLRFRVHPAFRPNLDIIDDDVPYADM